ncbi:hypothetical protein B0H19DRAFT_1070558 [Mycena capillaripes]|nr:hypothetical protein B0H19DRAFT_1070558 [Mycena capillaripes]
MSSQTQAQSKESSEEETLDASSRLPAHSFFPISALSLSVDGASITDVPTLFLGANPTRYVFRPDAAAVTSFDSSRPMPAFLLFPVPASHFGPLDHGVLLIFSPHATGFSAHDYSRRHHGYFLFRYNQIVGSAGKRGNTSSGYRIASGDGRQGGTAWKSLLTFRLKPTFLSFLPHHGYTLAIIWTGTRPPAAPGIKISVGDADVPGIQLLSRLAG